MGYTHMHVRSLIPTSKNNTNNTNNKTDKVDDIIFSCPVIEKTDKLDETPAIEESEKIIEQIQEEPKNEKVYGEPVKKEVKPKKTGSTSKKSKK